MRDEVRADALLASLEQEHRGKLKVFLGAAPGVGKTYAMLQAVREQAREGVDILIGVVETHGRQETLALLDKLPIQPRQLYSHRQLRLEEMDLDGLLERKPAIAVVDSIREEAEDGTVGGSYAHAVVRTDARDGPTEFTATASYCRCSPLGAEIAGQTPCAEHVATLWPPTRTSKPVTDGYEVCAAPGSTRSVRLPSA